MYTVYIYGWTIPYLLCTKKRYITRSIIDFANGKHARHVQSLSCARYVIAWRNHIIWLVCVACCEGYGGNYFLSLCSLKLTKEKSVRVLSSPHV